MRRSARHWFRIALYGGSWVALALFLFFVPEIVEGAEMPSAYWRCCGIFTLGIGVGWFRSTRFRIWVWSQTLFAPRDRECPLNVDPEDVLERDFDVVSKECMTKALHRLGGHQELVSVDARPTVCKIGDRKVVLLKAVLRAEHGAEREVHNVAVWDIKRWVATGTVLGGDVEVARRELTDLADKVENWDAG